VIEPGQDLSFLSKAAPEAPKHVARGQSAAGATTPGWGRNKEPQAPEGRQCAPSAIKRHASILPPLRGLKAIWGTRIPGVAAPAAL
jgi:hypothetical protein